MHYTCTLKVIISLSKEKHIDERSYLVTYTCIHTVTVFSPIKTQESERTMD